MIRSTREYEEIGAHVTACQNFHALFESTAKETPPGLAIVKDLLPPPVQKRLPTR